MFSWSGLGFLTPLILLAPYFLAHYIFIFFGLSTNDNFVIWPYIFVSFISTIILYVIGNKLNREEIIHTFCGHKIERWAYLHIALVLVVYGLFCLGEGGIV